MQAVHSKRKEYMVQIRRTDIQKIMKQKRETIVQNQQMSYFFDYLQTFDQESSTIFISILDKFKSLQANERVFMAYQVWNVLCAKDIKLDPNVSYCGLIILLSSTFEYLNLSVKQLKTYWKPQYLRIMFQQIFANLQAGKNDENISIYNLAKQITQFQHHMKQIQLNQEIIQKIIDVCLQIQSQDNLALLYLVLTNVKEKDIRKKYRKKLIQLGRILHHRCIYQQRPQLQYNLMLLIGFHCQYPPQYHYIVQNIINNFNYYDNISFKLRFIYSQIESNLFSFEMIFSFLLQYQDSFQFKKKSIDKNYFLIIIIQLLRSQCSEEQAIQIFEQFFSKNKIEVFMNPYQINFISQIIQIFFRYLPSCYQEYLLQNAKICLEIGKYAIQKYIITNFCYRLLIKNKIPFHQLNRYMTPFELHQFWKQLETNTLVNNIFQ